MSTWLPGCRSTAWRSAQPWQRVTGAKTTACSHSCSMPGQTWPPAIRDLTGDHAAIAAILHQIRALALHGKATPAESLPELRRELDGLAAIVESHFGYEERAISAALDHGVPDTGWSRPVLRPSEPQHPVP